MNTETASNSEKTAFKLDTSGEVRTPTTPAGRPGLRWGDLDACYYDAWAEALADASEDRPVVKREAA